MLSASLVSAEVRTYTGIGEYIMSEYETINIAKMRAKDYAKRNAQEQAGIYLSSYSKQENFHLVKDEIETITANIVDINKVDYKIKPAVEKDNWYVIESKVEAVIDTDNLNQWLRLADEDRNRLVDENMFLKRAIIEQDKQIDDVKNKINLLKAQGGDEEIIKLISEADKVFLSNQIVEEAKQLRWNDYNSAVLLYERALKVNPNNAYAYIGLADPNNKFYGTSKKENYEKALEMYNKNIENNPNDATLYKERGILHVRYFQNYDSALNNYNKAIQLSPNDDSIYYYRASLYGILHKYNKALADWNKCIKLNSNEAKYYWHRGLCYEDGLKQYNKALTDFNKLIELEPNNDSNYWIRGHLYEKKLHQYDKALDDYTKAIKIKPNDDYYYSLRASLYEKLKQYDKTLEDYTKIIQLKPEAENYYRRANLYRNIKQYKAAIDDYLKVVEIKLNTFLISSDIDIGIDCYSNLSECYKALGDNEKAEYYYQKYFHPYS